VAPFALNASNREREVPVFNMSFFSSSNRINPLLIIQKKQNHQPCDRVFLFRGTVKKMGHLNLANNHTKRVDAELPSADGAGLCPKFFHHILS
jgi:hypothetical protein